MSLWDDFKKHKESGSDKKFLYKEGNYICVIESVYLDLQNKYGPRVSVTLTHKNKSKAWIQINKSMDDNMWPIYDAIKFLKIEENMKQTLEIENVGVDKVLTDLHSVITNLVGHYISVYVKTAKNGKQYTHLKGISTQAEYDSFNFPPMIVVKNDDSSSLGINTNEEIPF